MEKRFATILEEFLAGHKRYRTWQKAFSAMAMVVVFCTTYMLILPAITLDDAKCGYEEHIHTEECYIQQPKAYCGLEVSEDHQHGSDCYHLICSGTDEPENPDETVSNENVSDEDTTMDEAAEETEPVGSDANSGETVTTTMQALHFMGDFSENEENESDIHEHSDSCYEMETILVCDIEEHIHTDACYPTEEDLENEKLRENLMDEDWASSLPDLIGDWREDTVAVAMSQIGYAEHENYSRYGAWYNEPNGNWDGAFAAFTLEFAGVPQEQFPTTPSAYMWAEQLQQNGLFQRADGYTPVAGDVAFFDTDANMETDRVGIVADVTAEELTVIEGDYFTGEQFDQIAANIYAMGDAVITGYGVLPEQVLSEEEQENVDAVIALIDALPLVEDAKAKAEQLKADGNEEELAAYAEELRQLVMHANDNYTALTNRQKLAVNNYDKLDAYLQWLETMGVLADGRYIATIYTDDTYTELSEETISIVVTGEVPEGAEVRAFPAAVSMDDADVICAYDINIFTRNGVLWQPETPVIVEFYDLPEVNEEYLAVYYVAEDESMEQVPAQAGEDAVSFATDHFSVYAVVDTTKLQSVAEPGNPEAAQALIDSGFFEYWSNVAQQEETPAALYGRYSMKARTMAASASQITNQGGERTSDDKTVTVSKTIVGTDVENVFDITLAVDTTTNITELQDDPDMAVVIVMDISNTMREDFGDSTRYAAAMTAAEHFLDEFAVANTGYSKVGYVAFNTNAHKIFGLSDCSTTAEATALKNTMRTRTGNIINAEDYGSSHSRFTNIEAGLKMADDMLAGASNSNKFIIFLSDGFPTTYISSGYNGYDPYCKSGTLGRDGVFGDMVWGGYSLYGTSYSDKAAIRAREEATRIKNSGAKIFTIGIDVSGQSIERYLYTCSDNPETYNGWSKKQEIEGLDGYYWRLDSSGNKVKNPNRVVDRGTNVGVTKAFEIGVLENLNDFGAFKNWLGNSIGSGYYYDSTNTAGLEAAYEQIFNEIKSTTETANALKWIASDPMPTLNNETTMEFIGFFNKGSVLQVYPPMSSLTGSSVENGENTVSYDEYDEAISWNLKQSGYTTSGSGSSTTYHYTVTYRVRLKNELAGFVDGKSYNTNGTTTLTYQNVTIVDGKETISGDKTINFPIPAVKGYLADLTFEKVTNNGEPLQGAEFTLTHDTATCSLCRGDGNTYVGDTNLKFSDGTQVYNRDVYTNADKTAITATSGEDGIVTFKNIPSGHTYTLVETVVPKGYVADGSTYSVVVAYDQVSITQTYADGTKQIWNITNSDEDFKIVNSTGTILPQTGGFGTTPFYVMGSIFVLLSAGLLYWQHSKRKGAI